MSKNIKIGLLRETKSPIDNRVPLTPAQAAELMRINPNLTIVAQSSEIRAFHDDEYKAAGVNVVDSVDDCDYLLGIKEVAANKLINGKKYIFFGHIAKEQSYNKSLCKAMIAKGITFADWEYMTEDNVRLIAFGHWAGIVGVYNGLRLYGLRTGKYELPKPYTKSTVEDFVRDCKSILPILGRDTVNIIITGNGRVANGAMEFLEKVGIEIIHPKDLTSLRENKTVKAFQLGIEEMVARKDGKSFTVDEFKDTPEDYISKFSEYAQLCDILISCHFWQNNAPKYITSDMVNDIRIDTIADVTCDIKGSIETTIRPSTHDDPFYAIDRTTLEEVDAMTPGAIGVMAVDTCPNALPRDASEDFGNQIIKYLIPEILKDGDSSVLDRATIIREGKLTPGYMYLENYAYN